VRPAVLVLAVFKRYASGTIALIARLLVYLFLQRRNSKDCAQYQT